MSVYFGSGGHFSSWRNRAFDLSRHRDRHGKLYEVRKNKLPRGGVVGRMIKIQHESIKDDYGKKIDEIKTAMFARGEI